MSEPESKKSQQSTADHAAMLCARGKYAEAEHFYRLALWNETRELGPEHVDLIVPLHKLGIICRIQEKNDEAAGLYCQALLLSELHYGPRHLLVATRLNFLAGLYSGMGANRMAEHLLSRSLEIYREKLTGDHPVIGLLYLGLALVSRRLGKNAQADEYYQQALNLRAQQVSADTAENLIGLAESLYGQGRYDDSELVLRHALILAEEAICPDHPFIADSLERLAAWNIAQGQTKIAAKLYERALIMRCHLFADSNYELKSTYSKYAQIMRNLGEAARAEELLQLAKVLTS